MTYGEAIDKLRKIQSQIIHGSNTFGEIADVMEQHWHEPWLGNATTGQLLDEIRARVDCSYSTVKGSQKVPG